MTSSTSSIKRWPSSEVVLSAADAWAKSAADQRPDLIALGFFGSYARGDAGFGSDLDLIAVVSNDDRPAAERGLDWRTEALPVPADLLVYTFREWKLLEAEGGRFAQTLKTEVRWLVAREALSGPEPERAAPVPTTRAAEESSESGNR